VRDICRTEKCGRPLSLSCNDIGTQRCAQSSTQTERSLIELTKMTRGRRYRLGRSSSWGMDGYAESWTAGPRIPVTAHLSLPSSQ
jgi:hypothetical protein